MSTALAPTETASQRHPHPIFSAYEVGRKVLTVERLKELSGYEYDLPNQDQPAVDVYELYRNYPELQFLPVADDNGQICGYTLRNQFLAILSKNHYSRELMLRPDVKLRSMMRTNPVILDAFATLSEASTALMNRPEDSRFDPFVVTLDGKFYGISTVDLVLRGMNSFLRRDNEACLEAQNALLQWSPDEALFQHPEIPVGESRENPSIAYSRYVAPLAGPGGDFARVYGINASLTFFVLFDVCGKGLKASAMVSIIGSALHTLLSDYSLRQALRPAQIGGLLRKLNTLVCDLSPDEMYATGIAGAIDHKNEVLSVFDFGHGMCWLSRSFKAHRLEMSGIGNSDQAPFFGIHPDLSIRPVHYRLKPGDLIFMCSDGIAEQKDDAGRMFGSERVQEILERTIADPYRINREVLNYWESFREGSRITDDVSMLSLIYSPQRA
ncbi:MAG: SpoIIE family protein phosphatase [Leptospiraceae bacterium]|nr:SpoIIE family protein phosphatase [Leptospiraceae bacterium]